MSLLSVSHRNSSGTAPREIAWGALTNWLAFVATLAVSFFLAPFFLQQLGTARYGIWCIAEAFLGYFTLFDLGIAACLVRYVARCYTRGELTALNRYAATAFWLYCGAAVAVLMLGIPLALLLAPLLQQRGIPPCEPVTLFLILMLLQFALTLPLSVFPTLLEALQLFGRKSVVRLVILGLRTTCIVLVIGTAPSLLGLGIILAVSQVAEQGLMLMVLRRYLPALSLSWRWIHRSDVGEVLSYSRDALLAMVAGRLGGQSGSLLAGVLLSTPAAAHYALSYRLVDMGKNLLRAATTTLTPAFSQREAAGDHLGLRNLFLQATRLVLYLTVPLQLGLILFGHPFLQRWLGTAAVADSCYPVAVLLSLTLTPGVAQSVAARVLYGLGQLRHFSRFSLLEAVTGLALGLVWTSWTGLNGLALAIVGPHVLFCLWTIRAACRATHTTVRDYWYEACCRPLLAIGVPATIWWWLSPIPADWYHLFFTGFVGLIPYVLIVLVWEGWLQRLARPVVSRATALLCRSHRRSVNN
jgi:O-antigen/teichoic acid export membrane protein